MRFEEGVEGGWGCGGDSARARQVGSRHVDVQAMSRVRFGSTDASGGLRWRWRERGLKLTDPKHSAHRQSEPESSARRLV